MACSPTAVWVLTLGDPDWVRAPENVLADEVPAVTILGVYGSALQALRSFQAYLDRETFLRLTWEVRSYREYRVTTPDDEVYALQESPLVWASPLAGPEAGAWHRAIMAVLAALEAADARAVQGRWTHAQAVARASVRRDDPCP